MSVCAYIVELTRYIGVSPSVGGCENVWSCMHETRRVYASSIVEHMCLGIRMHMAIVGKVQEIFYIPSLSNSFFT